MNKFIKISLVVFFAIVNLNIANAQWADSLFAIPTYTLTATNIEITQPDRYEWDVYMKHTNGDETPFIYGSAQYYFEFNTGVANPGDTLRLVIIGSDLPVEFRPVSPSVTGNIIRMAPNLPGTPETSPIIDTAGPGTKIVRLRLRNVNGPFTADTLNLRWKSVLPNPYTKIAAFTGEDNGTLVEIQTPETHFVDPYTGIGIGNQVSSLQLPTEFSVSQNFPNPFNPTTKIDYTLPIEGTVSILVYDIAGREVMKLVNEVQSAGFYSVNFNGINLASGMYFYRINVVGADNKNFTDTKRMVLIK